MRDTTAHLVPVRDPLFSESLEIAETPSPTVREEHKDLKDPQSHTTDHTGPHQNTPDLLCLLAALQARVVLLADENSDTLALMLREFAKQQAAAASAAAGGVEELQMMGFGHLAALATIPLAATTPAFASAPLIALADLPAHAPSKTCRRSPLNCRRPRELQLPGSRSSSRPSSGDSWAGERGGGRSRRCTPVLWRARMVSPDDDEGVMASLLHPDRAHAPRPPCMRFSVERPYSNYTATDTQLHKTTPDVRDTAALIMPVR